MSKILVVGNKILDSKKFKPTSIYIFKSTCISNCTENIANFELKPFQLLIWLSTPLMISISIQLYHK